MKEPDAGRPAVAAVMPVRGGGPLLGGALAALRAQGGALDEIVVVDDSAERSLGELEGARVLTSGARGPYAARNIGWRSTRAEIVLFCDVRSRPRPAWAQRLAALFEDREVALAGCEVRVREGTSLAERAAASQQFYELRKYLGRHDMRPYLPTCNLAVRRDDLEMVDGFAEIRSGGDADLCWRILNRPGRRLATLPEVLMDWVPRDRLRDYLEQNHRYGASHRALRRRWAGPGVSPPEPVSRRLLARRALRATARTASTLLRRSDPAAAVIAWGRLAFDLGFRSGASSDDWANGELRILFVGQGRASPGAAMGIARARDAREANRDAVPPGVITREIEVRPFTRPERLLARPMPGLRWGGIGVLQWHLMRSDLARRAIAAQVREARPDVVQVTTDQVGLLLGRLQRRVPIVPSLDIPTIDWVRLIRGIPLDRDPPPSLAPLATLERRALEAAPLVIAWTETVAERVRLLAPRAQVRVLHPGLDLSTFAPADRRPGSGPARVLFVGGRWRAKGGPELVEAIGDRLGDDILLDVVTAEEVPEQRGLSIHRGSPGSRSVTDLFTRADIFCLPTGADAVPFVVLEAMACGLPVVSTTIASIPELVGDAGILVEPGDVPGIRSALDGLIADPARRRETGARARARVKEHYDAALNTPRLFELLREAAGGTA